MPFTEDIGAFFTPAEFGSEATINGGTVVGIFDDEYVSPFGEVEATAAMFTCAAADLAAVTRGTAIAIGAVAYRVANVQKSNGIARVKLERA